MSINKTSPSTDVSDRATREVGRVSIVDDYQEDTLRLILHELRRMTVLLAILADHDPEDINAETLEAR